MVNEGGLRPVLHPPANYSSKALHCLIESLTANWGCAPAYIMLEHVSDMVRAMHPDAVRVLSGSL